MVHEQGHNIAIQSGNESISKDQMKNQNYNNTSQVQSIESKSFSSFNYKLFSYLQYDILIYIF